MGLFANDYQLFNKDEIHEIETVIGDPDTNRTVLQRCIVAKLLHDGANYDDITTATGLSERTVKRYAHDIRYKGFGSVVNNGWKRRWERGDPDTVDRENRVKLIEMELIRDGEHITVRRIQDAYSARFNDKISVGTVHKYLKRG